MNILDYVTCRFCGFYMRDSNAERVHEDCLREFINSEVLDIGGERCTIVV